jgi:hypothetical protein
MKHCDAEEHAPSSCGEGSRIAMFVDPDSSTLWAVVMRLNLETCRTMQELKLPLNIHGEGKVCRRRLADVVDGDKCGVLFHAFGLLLLPRQPPDTSPHESARRRPNCPSCPRIVLVTYIHGRIHLSCHHHNSPHRRHLASAIH